MHFIPAFLKEVQLFYLRLFDTIGHIDCFFLASLKSIFNRKF